MRHLLLLLPCLLLLLSPVTTGQRDHPHRVRGLPLAPDTEAYASPMYAGWCPIRGDSPSSSSSALFYWYFEAENPKAPRPPLLIWLQGGPGSSSMIGLFQELGPFRITPEGLRRRKYAWTNAYDVLFIDSPIGTGFSPLPNPSSSSRLASSKARQWTSLSPPTSPPTPMDHLCRDLDCVTSDLMSFLRNFYSLHPHLRHRDLYLTGESYGGKYIPAFATAILDANEQNPHNPIPLKGIAIGNGLTDPISQVLTHPDQALALGLVDEPQAKVLESYATRSALQAKLGQWLLSLQARLTMFDLFANFTGGVNFYDVRRANQPNDWRPMRAWLTRPDVQRALNVPDFGPFRKTPEIAIALLKDIMKSTAHLFPRLLNNMHVLLYQGNYDFRDGVMGNSPWISNLPWPHKEHYALAPRQVWMVGRYVAGYVKEYATLRRVIVLGAGHLVPMDQPQSSYEMISSWVNKVQRT